MANSDSNQAGKSSAAYQGPLADPAKLTPEVFDSHLGEMFRVNRLEFEHDDTHVNPQKVGQEEKCEVIEIKLIEVTRYPKLEEIEGGFEHRPREPFSLLFEGPIEPTLMSALHRIEHDQLGTGRLFLNPVQVAVPGKSGADVRFYESPLS